jgi:hypothetical protein
VHIQFLGLEKIGLLINRRKRKEKQFLTGYYGCAAKKKNKNSIFFD